VVAEPAPIAATAEIESEVWRIGAEIHAALPSPARHPVRALDARAMQASSEDLELRAALFRLVDVTPACRSLDDLAGHLGEYLEEVQEPTPPLSAAMRAAHTRTGRRALGAAASLGIRHMAHRFIVGETPEAALGTLRQLWSSGVASSLDLLGEATVTADEADRYARRCDAALEAMASAAADWPGRPALESDPAGPVPRANLSVKVTALTPLLHAEAPDLGVEDAARRVRPLLRRAAELGAHLHFDMESLDTLETTLELALALLTEEEFREQPSAGIVLQAYLRDSTAMLERVFDWARSHRRSSPLSVRLVKGAYWDHEIVEARQEGWPAPVFETKAECDRSFERLTRRLLEARPLVRVAVASHNLRSISHALACDRILGGDGRDLELQVLRGLGDDLAEALADRGLRVRAYCPVGDLVSGMAYLVRRLLENTANESFLGQQQRGAPLEELLAPP
jgi:RHH-type proline utilization regulon transcriptional repressor/proline dehydrogenase/delta 1-pyrroline-5-carboxylate dehydrogenase